MALFSLLAKIKVEGAEESRLKLIGVGDAVQQAGEKAKTHGSAIGSVMRSIATSANLAAAGVSALAVATVGLGRFMAGPALAAAASYDSLVRALATTTNSTADLQAQMARLQQLAKLPGIGFEEAVRGSVRLQAVGVSARLAEKTMAGFANAVARSGGSKADFGEAIRQLTQIASQGKLAGDELRVIAERIPGFSNVIRSAFGTVDTKAINEMGLSSVQLVEKIAMAIGKLPKATGGIQTALDNMSDTLQQKLYAPLGRISAAFAGAFGPALERLLTAAAPGFERMAAAAERLSRTRLASFFNATVGNLEGFNRVIAITTGLMIAMAGPRVVGSIVTGVRAIITALKALQVVMRQTGIMATIMQAINTRGASIGASLAGLGAGIGAAMVIDASLNRLFSSDGPSLPSVPGGLYGAGGGGGSTLSAMGSLVASAVKTASDLQQQKMEMQYKWLLAIERNTAKSADALTMRRQSLGGADLAKLGVTAAELKGGSGPLYSPPDTYARPAGSELERVLGKIYTKHDARKGRSGRLRNA